MNLTSTAFAEGDTIPAEFTCDGENVSPPLTISGLPEGTVSLVLIMDDPDAPLGTWDHWVVFDIEPVTEIPRGVVGLGVDGITSFGTTGYGGPCPPSGSHRYIHRVYALDTALGLPEGSTKVAVLEAMLGHLLAEASLTGLYR
ncbi:MAG: YbhB/YbcL family Raf kinase inhibitor-like protein [Actinobacteria bacterium]|nr:YbhB/YbcL family Raf kinase inhibitor-like protein [Actinomycetota bacterium]